MSPRASPDLGDLIALYDGAAATAMYDEVVTERAHALQAALQAEEAGAPDALVAAALLHDVGRLLIEAADGFEESDGVVDSDGAHRVADLAHERVGAEHLATWFGTEVTGPIGRHVVAKRYLCAVEEGYLHQLSPVSVRSLAVQGGPMTADEATAFRAGPHWRSAVRLRRWDDGAKQPNRPTRQVADYLPLLERLAET